MTKSVSRQRVKIRRLPHGQGLALPSYQTIDAAGMDLLAAVPEDAPLIIKRGGRALVPTGLAIELPSGLEAQVRPRSGLAAKFGVTVLNSPGTIDADYRGEVSVILINHGNQPFSINRGDRVAQMVLAPVTQVTLVEATILTATHRGAGGFGSTGVSVAVPAKKAPKKALKTARKAKPSVRKRTSVAPKAKNAKSATHKTAKRKPTSPSKR